MRNDTEQTFGYHKLSPMGDFAFFGAEQHLESSTLACRAAHSHRFGSLRLEKLLLSHLTTPLLLFCHGGLQCTAH